MPKKTAAKEPDEQLREEGSRVAAAVAEERRASDLVLHPERGAMHTGEPAYKRYSAEMVNLVRKSLVPPEATNADLYMLLELAATYQLDPFTREIWAVKMQGKNASGGKVVIMVGRDGLLAVAQRSPDYMGFRAGVVHEKDTFEVVDEGLDWNGQQSFIRFRSGGTNAFNLEGRGPIVGAFAEVFREGKPPVHFLARLDEYMRSGEYSPWSKQVSAMILKVALVSALRLTFRVSGLYIQDEMTGRILDGPRDPDLDTDTVTYDEPVYSQDPVMNQHISNLFEAADLLEPGSYPAGQRKLLAANLDERATAELVTQLERFIVDKGGQVPAMPDPAEMVEDAEFSEVDPEAADDDARAAFEASVAAMDEDIPFGEQKPLV